MNRWLAMFLIGVVAHAEAGTGDTSNADTNLVCSDSWYRAMEEQVPTGDGQAHGPDVGSDEWQSVVEFKLGIRDQPDVPARDTEAWCRHIDQIVRSRRSAPAGNSDAGRSRTAAGPAFDCQKVAAGSIEAMICEDEELSALDRKLADVYAAASRKATNEHPPVLKAMQRGWIKGRNDCWKDSDTRGCVRDEYVRRIAELQARYHLVPYNGPIRFFCDGNPANEVVATFFSTEPATLIAERGDTVQPSGSGSKYQGRNETFWEHQGEAVIVWGHDAPEMHCQKAP